MQRRLRAGLPGGEPNYQRDGVLETWLEGPDFGPVKVVEHLDLGWRQFTNVSIDTLYFSVFFGGSSPTFQAKKDEVRCLLHSELLSQSCACNSLLRQLADELLSICTLTPD